MNAYETWVHLSFSWAGKAFSLHLAGSDRYVQYKASLRNQYQPCPYDRVYDLKAALSDLTKVPPERQKILGLVKGKLPPDEKKMYGWLVAFVTG